MNYILDELREINLTEVMEIMMNYVDLIDISYQEKSNNNILRYWQSNGVTLKSIFLTDLLDWLCCLAFCDGFIAPEEVQFINTYLKQEFSSKDIIELCKFRINQDYFKNLPLSFILFYENDLVMKSMDVDMEANSVEHLHMFFMTIGAQFIYCDNNASFKEISLFNGFMDDLYDKINDFNIIQKELAILEMSNGTVGQKFSEDRYSFNEKVINNYRDDLRNIEKTNKTNFNHSTFDIKNIHLQTIKNKTNTSWNLKSNPNNYYNFTGEFDNHLNDFNDIFTKKNCQKLQDTYLTHQQYIGILNKIKTTSDKLLAKTIEENNIDIDSLSILEKILLFTESFVDVNYESSGADLGNYGFNTIYLDDRLYTANQITTLIHELAHHLIAEIFEQSVMILLNTDKTDAIEAYVSFTLMCSDMSLLFNEYCAHTVEGRFTPHGYQNYGSFENILKRFDLNNDKNVINGCMGVGNTFCKDILTIIEPFIDYNLREEIKQQFKEDFSYPPNYQGIFHEIKSTVDMDHLLEFINAQLLIGFAEALNQPEMLLDFWKEFEFHNHDNKSRRL